MSSVTITRHVSRAKAKRLVAGGRLITCSIAPLTASIGYARQASGGHDVAIAGTSQSAPEDDLRETRHFQPDEAEQLRAGKLAGVNFIAARCGGRDSAPHCGGFEYAA